MGSGFSVKTAVIGGIAMVALISQMISGVGQYLEGMAAGREQVRQINEAVLQPVTELASRGISGGNQMMLTDAAAMALYKASGVRYLKVEGMSEGAEKTAFTEAIPPQKMTHEFLAPDANAALLKNAASTVTQSRLVENDYLYVIKAPLPAVKNGGQIIAVFSAERLADLPSRILLQVAPLTLGVVALGLVLAWFIGARIAQPITRLAGRVEEVAETLDLTQDVELSASDISFNREAGEIARAFNRLQDSLKRTLAEVLENVNRVNHAVEAVSGLASAVAARSEEQSDSSARMAAAMEQSTANLAEIASNAKYLDTSARESGTLSAQGTAIIRQASDEMAEISRTVENGTVSIAALGRQSHEISAIVQVIREVADQTNLLALNAAIEAARAGEQGRGFAVVADEVRKLAERTGQSTTEITGMIAAIQASSTNAVDVMGNTVKRVGIGVNLAGQAGNAITQISESNVHVMGGVEAISEALQQQNLAYQDIQQHVERIALMTEENTHAAHAAADAARELENLSRAMRQAVSRFRI